MNPAELSALMNEYYETLFAPVRARQGIISDVVGDAMLAIWTGPHTQGLLRAPAVDAALAFRALQSEAPDDGPVRFFIERCRRYDARPPADGQGVLALAEK